MTSDHNYSTLLEDVISKDHEWHEAMIAKAHLSYEAHTTIPNGTIEIYHPSVVLRTLLEAAQPKCLTPLRRSETDIVLRENDDDGLVMLP
jgi:hypothetical protein